MKTVASNVAHQQANAPAANDSGVLTARGAWRLLAVLAALQLPVWLGWQSVSATAKLWQLAERTNPYFVPEHFGRLYVWTPLVVIGAFSAVLTPGLLAALASGLAKSIESWVLYGFAISLIALTVVTGCAQSVAARPITGFGFLLITATCSIAAAVLLFRRVQRSKVFPLPSLGFSSLAGLLVPPCVLLIALAPKFYWENFNGDGVHAFESARLLLHQPLPFWPATAGEIAAFPGITSMLFAFPGSWFIRLFGEYEIAARAPLLLYLVVLFCALVLVAKHGRAPLRTVEKALIWGALALYTVVVAYSATYNPYSADIALPATQDTLLMVCFAGFVHGFLDNRTRWSVIFGLLTFLSLPNGQLLLGFWLVAVALTWRPLPWRRMGVVAGLLVGCVALSAVGPVVVKALGLPAPGGEYAASGLRQYFAELNFTDWRRFNFFLVPCGILPGLALLAWRWQDQVARSVTLVAAASLFFFYVQAATALHYYIPVMLLPLIVYWRLNRPGRLLSGSLFNLATAVALLAGFVVSVPRSWAVDTRGRMVGYATLFPDDRYHDMDPIAFRRSSVLKYVFPYDWNRAVPDSTYGGSPLVWNYYAHQRKEPARAANYIVQDTSVRPVPSGRRAGVMGKWAVYVVDDSVWNMHRAPQNRVPPGSALYSIPRRDLFR